MPDVALCRLSALLGTIWLLECAEPVNYAARNDVILTALAQARMANLPAGIRIDPDQPAWPVAFIELPTGQVSWHLPQHGQAWDGHTTEEKYGGVHALIAAYPPPPSTRTARGNQPEE